MVLDHGLLKNRARGMQETYYMTLLNSASLPEIMDLQESVYASLINKNVLVKDSMRFIEKSMSEGGFVIGVYNERHRLISYRFIALPQLSQDNMGIDLSLPMQQLKKVAHLETTVVHPDYRGNGMQSKTLQVAFPMLESQNIQHVVCTVSPFNIYSLVNIVNNGLSVKVLKKKYGSKKDGSDGLWRFILHKDLKADVSTFSSDIKVHRDHFPLQRTLLDDGFIGNAITSDGLILSYVR